VDEVKEYLFAEAVPGKWTHPSEEVRVCVCVCVCVPGKGTYPSKEVRVGEEWSRKGKY
jgi:hypothetical protein